MADEFVGTTRSPDISFLTRGANPPTVYYVGPEDHIVIDFWSSAAAVLCFVRLRLLLPNGQVVLSSFELLTDGTTLRQRIVQPLAEGFVLGCVVEAHNDGVCRGQIFATIGICKGIGAVTTPFTQLVGGYVTYRDLLSWPPGGPVDSLGGRGWPISTVSADPAAGAEISLTCPTNLRMRLMGMVFTLVTSAAVANRVVSVVIDDATNILLQVPSPSDQAASLTYTYSLGVGLPFQAVRNNIVTMPLSEDAWLKGTYRVRTLTGGLQAGDDFSAARIYAEQFLHPPGV